MSSDREGALLQYILEAWRVVPDTVRPWGMWLTLQAPIPEAQDWLQYDATTIQRAWFLDELGVHPRCAWEFRRFWVVQFEQPWCTHEFRERGGILGQKQFPIGFGGFAEYVGSECCYVEFTFGKLYGRGYRLELSGDRVISESGLWIS